MLLDYQGYLTFRIDIPSIMIVIKFVKKERKEKLSPFPTRIRSQRFKDSKITRYNYFIINTTTYLPAKRSASKGLS